MEGKPLNKSHFDLLNIGLNTHDQIDAYIAASEAKVVTAQVRNQTGAALLKGTVVYLSGASGNKPLVVKAQANSEVTSSKTFGIIKSDIPDNQNGEVVFVGSLVGLDTLTYPEGTALWLSPSVAGGYTSTKPVAPNHAVFLGVVTRQHQNQGSIEVRIVNGYELEELHNVLITNPQNGQVIAYDSADQLYKNTTLQIEDVNNLQTSLGSKQNTLVSGTNIKTVNNQSILGSGNIDIAGGGGATNLTYTASPTQGQVNSDTGTDAVIPATDGTNAGLFLPSEKSKLSGIVSGATANSTDAQLRDRTTHTGTQAISTVTNLQSTLDSKLEAASIANFETTTQLNSRDTANRNRANHTGTQLASTISDFASTVLATVLTGLSVATSSVITATDTALIALGKLQAQITTLGTSKQDTLVSGTNIKTVNTQSILGSGNITIGGSAAWGGITGTLSTQTDLQTALDGKQAAGDYATNTALTNGLSAKENTITAGTVSQYYRGDKTFQPLDKTVVGLSNVDNTSDTNKPISTATQTALNAKQNTITTGTISQYFRGDLSLATLDKTAVGLANVANADTTTTANIADSVNKRFVTDSQQTVLSNTSGTNTGDNAVNSLYSGLATSKQDTLISGTNIKTLEGQSLLGGGNIDLTKSDVGLSNVDNTSDANKPISTATQTALNAKENTLNADQKRKITISTSAPTGGADGDVWFQYTP